MYDTEEKQRECLVLKSGWAPADAERRLAALRAEVKRLRDSINAEEMKAYVLQQRQRDSVAGVRTAAQAVRDRAIAARRRKDSLFAASKRYWGDKHFRLFYANVPGCMSMYRILPADRVFFDTREEAEEAGYQRVTFMDC